LAEDILHDHAEKISGLTLIPSSGGVYEITLGDTLLYSKKQTGSFPEPLDIKRMVGAA